MEDIAIEINNVSKVYKLYDKPIDRLKETISLTKKSYHKDFYALNSINLKIKKGETVGIIGKNGAGKSTLLKIITGVLTPTSGDVKVYGRISSLLELGAGFNPEYTGMENIYLNGTVMGMTKEEVDERLQDVLDFADIGDFINQPVKTYSSGMYVRLAFSVAINVNPDILIVDEALAVGDARFQLKCLGEIKRLKEKGITILFVSHSIEMLKSFTDKAVLINEGVLLKEGSPVDVGLEYYRLLFGNDNAAVDQKINNVDDVYDEECVIYPDSGKAYGKGAVSISRVRVLGLKGKSTFSPGDELEILFSCQLDRNRLDEIMLLSDVKTQLMFGLRMENSNGIVITDFASSLKRDFHFVISEECDFIFKYNIKVPSLASGEYWFSPEIAIGNQDNFVALCEYVYLFKLNCLNEDMVLGLLKFDYDINFVKS